MKILSIFSGIGGFDEGFRRAGMTCESVCERYKNARAILSRHFPEARQMNDVSEVGINTHDKTTVDVICGGFPCQDVSILGRRSGLAGERSGLWFEFARIIDEIEPRWVVVENVPGLLSSNNGRDFATIVQWLAKRGYGVVWRVLDSQYFGVPQRRRRVFIVGSFGNGRSAKVLFESPCHSRGDSAIENKPSPDGRTEKNRVIGTLLASGAGTYRVPNKNSHDFFVIDGNGEARRLTPTECERLQGFPDGWTSGLSDATRYRLLGNAVTVNVAEYIGKRLMLADKNEWF
jgi:DNA (cytosine-5)-methyltransferase 1